MQTVPRSYLFVPGNRPERFEKACAAGADVVVIDLEDSVPEADKGRAREAVAAWLSPAHPVMVRINGVTTGQFRDDLALCGRPGIAGVMLPKAERVDDLNVVAREMGNGSVLLPLIETAVGFANAQALAGALRVQRLVFGSIDFQMDLGITGDDEAMVYFRSKLVLVSRLAGREAPVDGVTVAVDDAERISADARRSRELGFGGKLCIHPRQVPAVNAAFRPSAQEIAWAERVLAAARDSSGAAVRVDGEMVDRPVILRAEAILAAAESD